MKLTNMKGKKPLSQFVKVLVVLRQLNSNKKA